MKQFLFFPLLIGFIFLRQNVFAQDYNWDVLNEKTKARSTVISDDANAYKLIHDDNELDLNSLPQATEVILTEASEAWYLEMLHAISIYSERTVFNKYNEWFQPRSDRKDCSLLL